MNKISHVCCHCGNKTWYAHVGSTWLPWAWGYHFAQVYLCKTCTNNHSDELTYLYWMTQYSPGKRMF